MNTERRCVTCARRIYSQRLAPDWASRHAGRGLCMSCWQITNYHGDIPYHAPPRLTRTRDELLADYVILRADGYTWRQCAARLNMTYAAFERAMLRARASGDRRATRPGESTTYRRQVAC